MTPNLRLFLLFVFTAGVSFYIGSVVTPEKTKIVTKVVEVEKRVEVDTHKETEVVESTTPSGVKTVTTKVIEDTKKRADTASKTQERSEEVTKRPGRVNISLLAGADLQALARRYSASPSVNGSLAAPITFGLHANTQLVGPFTVGIWGLTNYTGGFSVGLNF